ncbi:MAG: hypothetical protein HY051_02530 [Candidatus Aenigmarchaeota archaeon]|nr:hypothetical protein [Candidatus Aenigmarchaeota archaeon]
MKIEERDVRQKLNDGWLKAWVMVESLATKEDVSRQSLVELAKLIEKEQQIAVVKTEVKESHKVENPLPNIPEAYSTVLELEIVAKNYGSLARFVINYGPSAVEILEPKKIAIELGEAQNVLNDISTLVHRFAQAGVGGVVLSKGNS